MRRDVSETRRHGVFLTPGGRRLNWRAVADLARKQHGVISLSQLIACGFTSKGVQKLALAGKLHRIHQGVYALSPAPLSREGSWLAAVLAGGAGSLLAARSASANFGLITNASSLIDVMSPRRVRRAGIRAHRMPELEPRDRTVHLGIPCTSVARTLLDLAVARPGELGGALEQAEEIGVFDLNAIRDVIRRNEGGPGVRRLRSALAALIEPGPSFRSEFERRFRPIVRSAGLREPLVNHVIQLPDGSHLEVDYCWPDDRLVVECDGYEFHRDRRAFRNDRRRDRRLAAVGIRVLRYVWEDLDDRDAVRTQLAQIARTPTT